MKCIMDFTDDNVLEFNRFFVRVYMLNSCVFYNDENQFKYVRLHFYTKLFSNLITVFERVNIKISKINKPLKNISQNSQQCIYHQR